MRKCLRCGVEYSDDTNFCLKCGEKLASTNVCQRCGNPVNVEDEYCGKCGYKIEKEYHCNECGATISKNAKFCEECGAKVINPVVTIAPCKESPRKEKNDKKEDKKAKILFYAFNVLSIALIILFIVGCFGDVLQTKAISSGLSEKQTTSIEYFFGKAIKDIDETVRDMKYGEYAAVSRLFLALEYIVWIMAIVMAVAGLCIQVYSFYKNANGKKYIFDTKNLTRTDRKSVV